MIFKVLTNNLVNPLDRKPFKPYNLIIYYLITLVFVFISYVIV